MVKDGADSPAGGQVRLAPSARSSADSVGTLTAVGGADVVPDRSLDTLAAITDRTTDRLSGDNRYLTNVAVSQKSHPDGARTVLLASGENFPDGLAASAVGVALDAPLILTRRTALPEPTKAELSRLAPTKVIVAGGYSMVSDGVLASVRGLLPGATVVRAQGSDRFGTAQALASLLPSQSTTTKVAFVATGMDYPDALSVGPVAGKRSAPLLLTQPTKLPPATRDALAKLRPSTTYVIGNQMSSTVLSAIRTATGGKTTVIGGALRYDTAALVAQTFYRPTVPGIVLVPGLNFPDALSAGAAANRGSGPILLDPGRGTPAPATVDQARALSWSYPASGRVIRYIPIVHPDDDMSAMSVNAPDPRRYDVYVLLTSGNTTGYCNGKAISNPWRSQQYIPKPEPTGVYLSDLCTKQRRDSWDEFYRRVLATSIPTYTQRTGTTVELGGRVIPTPRRLDPQSKPVDATDIRVAAGADRAFVQFDLGDLTTDAVTWAILNTRQLRGGVLPDLPERDIVGAGYYNHTSTGSGYLHPDHDALHDTLATVDFDVPGSQYSPVGHVETGRAFGAKVSGYCSYMCHPASKTGYVGSMGTFQYSFGWLRNGRWNSGAKDVVAGFSEYQSFAKWF